MTDEQKLKVVQLRLAGHKPRVQAHRIYCAHCLGAWGRTLVLPVEECPRTMDRLANFRVV